MLNHITDSLLMIRPVAFHKNEQTVDNHYQKSSSLTLADVQEKALVEFDQFVQKLNTEGIFIIVFDDSGDPITPDSIFPNNWISFHEDGGIILYPMYAMNRRRERRNDIIEKLKSDFEVTRVDDSLVEWEKKKLH